MGWDLMISYTLGDIRVLCVSADAHVAEVLLHYDVYTHYPSGNTDMHDQRLHYTWRIPSKKTAQGSQPRPEIVCLHVSNAWEYDQRDTIYPVHYETVSRPDPSPPPPEQAVTVQAVDRCVHRIASSHILYFSTIKRSSKLQIHTQDGVVTIRDTLARIQARYPGLFLRIHSGYLVNPAHVIHIRRFALTLSDGTELPLPEKKYTGIKKILLGKSAEQ